MSSLSRRRPVTRTHRAEVSLELIVEGGQDYRELAAVIEFRRTPYRPATHWQPAEGCEIEDVEVVELVQIGPRDPVTGKFARTSLELPRWLSEWVRESISEDTLHAAADREGE